jgi:MFS superfamily sulfate permease-like transporter
LTATATLSLLVGLILVAASLLRLGFVANFISLPVLTGFKTGIGLVIVLDQLPKLLGVHIEKQNFFHDLWQLLQALPATSGLTLLMIRKGAILRTHEKLETSLRTGTVFHVSFFIC